MLLLSVPSCIGKNFSYSYSRDAYFCLFYSGVCYKKRMLPSSQKMPNSLKKPHSIQLVALGPMPEGRPRIKLASQSDVYREFRISE